MHSYFIGTLYNITLLQSLWRTNAMTPVHAPFLLSRTLTPSVEVTVDSTPMIPGSVAPRKKKMSMKFCGTLFGQGAC